jgi:hypothetical protein
MNMRPMNLGRLRYTAEVLVFGGSTVMFVMAVEKFQKVHITRY